ncbi:MAG: heavy-metal-associated domain-containing protein [Bacilli bacterium]|jgi:copper chaperone CopZ|nr:heavy-metal-associated domain-containing protein [Bacilli bacterium]
MKTVVKVDQMNCEHCAARVKDAILELDNVKRVKVNLETKEVKIVYKDELDLDRVKQLVTDAGYVFLG